MGDPRFFEFLLQLNVILWFFGFYNFMVFLLEVTTFWKPQIFTFLWGKPLFLYIIIRYRESENWGGFGGKSAESAVRES